MKVVWFCAPGLPRPVPLQKWQAKQGPEDTCLNDGAKGSQVACPRCERCLPRPGRAPVVDGQAVAAAEEERFTRRKHGKPPVPFATWELPERSAAWRLAEAGLSPDDLDAVAYSYDPALALPAARRDRRRPGGAADPVRPAGPDVPAHRPARPDRLASAYVPHHVAHAASAHLAAPYRSSSVLVLDGRGEAASHLAGRSVDGDLEILAAQRLPHSLACSTRRSPTTRVPALLGRVQGDGAGRLREAGLPPRAARGRQGHRRRRLHGRPDRASTPAAARRDEEWGRRARRPAASVRSGSRRSCSSWSMAGTPRPATATRPWPAGSRSTAWPTRSWLSRGRSSASGPTGRRRRRHRPGRAMHVAHALGDRVAPMSGAALGRGWTDNELAAWLATARSPTSACPTRPTRSPR